MRGAAHVMMTGWPLLASATSARAQDVGSEEAGGALRVSIAYFDLDGPDDAVAIELVYQVSRWDVWRLRPELGVMANSDAGVLGFAGITVPLDLPGRVQVSPAVSVGAYRRGRSLDLGRVLEFRSGIQVERPVRATIGWPSPCTTSPTPAWESATPAPKSSVWDMSFGGRPSPRGAADSRSRRAFGCAERTGAVPGGHRETSERPIIGIRAEPEIREGEQ